MEGLSQIHQTDIEWTWGFESWLLWAEWFTVFDMISSWELDIFLETMGIGVSLGRGGKNNIYIPVIKNEKEESKRARILVVVSIVQSGVMIYFRA